VTDIDPSHGRYRFSRQGNVEIETGQFASDEAAETYGRGLSKAQDAPVIISRHNIVDWEYVTEVDER
jgi:hypothetical protein